MTHVTSTQHTSWGQIQYTCYGIAYLLGHADLLAVHKLSTVQDLVVSWTHVVNTGVRTNLNLSNTLVALWTLLSLSSLTPVAIITYPDKGRNKGLGFRVIFISKLHIHKERQPSRTSGSVELRTTQQDESRHTNSVARYNIYNSANLYLAPTTT